MHIPISGKYFPVGKFYQGDLRGGLKFRELILSRGLFSRSIYTVVTFRGGNFPGRGLFLVPFSLMKTYY